MQWLCVLIPEWTPYAIAGDVPGVTAISDSSHDDSNCSRAVTARYENFKESKAKREEDMILASILRVRGCRGLSSSFATHYSS